MSNYFKRIPNFEYVNRKVGEKNLSQYIEVKNLFKRAKLREDIFSNLSYFEKYTIIGDERPDNVAFKFYDDPSLEWIILLSNNIINIQSEWPLSQTSFDKIMLEKYGSYENLYSGINHYKTEKIKDSRGIVVLKGEEKISPTWRTNGNFIETINARIGIIYSGNTSTPSTTATVFVQNGILGLEKNSEVVIQGVSESEYNGRFIVDDVSLFDPSGKLALQFTFKLSSVPKVALPTQTGSEEIRVLLRSDLSQEDYLFITQSRSNANYFEYYDSGFKQIVQVPSSTFVTPVTNYEYEINLENKKREIYILKPRYLSVVLKDLENIMEYKEGSTQYVSETLKRADNIRLFNS